MPRRSSGVRSMLSKLLRIGSVSGVHGRAKGVKDELIDNLIPVGLNFAVWDILERFSVALGSIFGCMR